MRKYLLPVPILALTLCAFSCSPVQNQARNTAAALQGAITAAQAQYQATCTTNPKQTACVAINQAVSAQNALITATESYCGWSTTNPPNPTTTTCVPVKTAQAALTVAIANATTFVTEIESILTSGGAK
jgi:hypothetical protein